MEREEERVMGGREEGDVLVFPRGAKTRRVSQSESREWETGSFYTARTRLSSGGAGPRWRLKQRWLSSRRPAVSMAPAPLRRSLAACLAPLVGGAAAALWAATLLCSTHWLTRPHRSLGGSERRMR
jgi:hypothetical protein